MKRNLITLEEINNNELLKNFISSDISDDEDDDDNLDFFFNDDDYNLNKIIDDLDDIIQPSNNIIQPSNDLNDNIPQPYNVLNLNNSLYYKNLGSVSYKTKNGEIIKGKIDPLDSIGIIFEEEENNKKVIKKYKSTLSWENMLREKYGKI